MVTLLNALRWTTRNKTRCASNCMETYPRLTSVDIESGLVMRNDRYGNIGSALILQEGNNDLEVEIHSVNSNLCSSLIRDAIRSDYLVFFFKRSVSKLVTFTSALISNEDGDTRNIEICSVFRYLSERIVPEAIRFDHPVYIQETLASEARLFRY